MIVARGRGWQGSRRAAVSGLRLARWQRHLTQEGLAALAGVSGQTVGRAERGRAIDAYTCHRLCEALGQDAEALGLRVGRGNGLPAGGELAMADDGGDLAVNRHQLLLGGAGLVGVLFGGSRLDLGRLEGVGAGARPDARAVDDLLAITHGYARQRGNVPPEVLGPAVRGHLRVLEHLLSGPQPPDQVRRLRVVASETATVAGWMAYLTQNLGDAAAFYTAGRQLAREAGDGTSLALSLGLASWLYSGVPRGGTGGPQPRALALLEEATAVAGRAAPAPLRALLWARRAEEHAIAGEAAATSKALERAEGAVGAVREPGAGMLNGISDSWLSGYRGSCAVLLHRPGGAVAELEGALRGGLADQGQGAAVMTDLAVAHAQQGDVERACELLGEVLSGAQGGEWRDQVQRIAGARYHLDRWRNSPAVRHLDQQLRAQFVA